MNKKLFFAIVLMLVFCSANGLYSQSTSENDDNKPKTDETESGNTQTQTKPAKLFDMKPSYEKGMKWKETAKIVIGQRTSEYSMKFIVDMKPDVEVTEIKSYQPSLLKFKVIKANVSSEHEYNGETRAEENEIDVKPFSAKIDENYCIESIVEDNDDKFHKFFLTVYPTGNIAGFMPPSKSIKVGESWKSDKIMPINLEPMYEDLDIALFASENTGEFKLISVEEKDESEIATITWNGKCVFQMPEDDGGTLTMNWEDTIQFDLTHKRLLSTKASTTLVGSEQPDTTYFFNLDRILEYEKSEKKEDKPEIGPKTDDDE